MSDPQMVIRLVEEGRRLYASGHLEDAIERWHDALVIDPNAKQAQLWLRRVRGSIVEPRSLDEDPEVAGRVGDTLKGLRRIEEEPEGPTTVPDPAHGADWAELLDEGPDGSADNPPPLSDSLGKRDSLFIDFDSSQPQPQPGEEVNLWLGDDNTMPAELIHGLPQLVGMDCDPMDLSLSHFARPEDPGLMPEGGWRFYPTYVAMAMDGGEPGALSDTLGPGNQRAISDAMISDLDDNEITAPNSSFGALRKQARSVDATAATGELPDEVKVQDSTLKELLNAGGTPPGPADQLAPDIYAPDDDEGTQELDLPPVMTEAVGLERLMTKARDKQRAGDFTGSYEAARAVLELEPGHPEALRCVEENTARLLGMYRSKLGALTKIPRIILRQNELVWQSLDHREGFVLSQVDGSTSYEEIIEISGMPEFEATLILSGLKERGLIG